MSRIFPVFEPFVYGDLFSITDAPQPHRDCFRSSCGECGRIFEAERRMGRPIRFCGDPCRRAHAARQQADWRAAAMIDPPIAPTECQHCGDPLPPRVSGPGRVRRYCSRRCLLRSREPPPAGDSLFDFIPDEPKEPNP